MKPQSKIKNKPYVPKCKPLMIIEPLYGWRADLTHRHDDGPATASWFLVELSELHDIVENGPHWDTIIKIEVYRISLSSSEKLTVEQSKKIHCKKAA